MSVNAVATLITRFAAAFPAIGLKTTNEIVQMNGRFFQALFELFTKIINKFINFLVRKSGWFVFSSDNLVIDFCEESRAAFADCNIVFWFIHFQSIGISNTAGSPSGTKSLSVYPSSIWRSVKLRSPIFPVF